MSRKAKELLNDLNPPQARAVEYFTGPLLILAGAGTGKTRVITYRIAYLIEELGVQPWNILALTFTNKAAEEMKERTVSLVGERARGVTLCTFHSFCNYVLRRDIELLGDYRSGFSIYDEKDSQSCIKKILKSMNLPTSSDFAPARVKHLISRAKNFGESPGEHVGMDNKLGDFIDKIAERYEETLLHNNAVDFDDLLLKTRELFLNHPDARERYAHRFGFMLVDEYQDTNRPQYDVLKLLAAPAGNITVVGDLDQSIYGWRGADVGNMISFEEDFNDVRTITLEQNYRSKQSILDAANELITNNAAMTEKRLWSELGEGEKVRLYVSWDERDEAQFVALEIDALIEEGYQLNDVAVLFRTKAQSRVFEETFTRAAIPYKLIGATGFYQRREIKDVVAYLRVVQNPRDFVSYARIANVPRRGIGPKTLEKIESLADEAGTLFDLIGPDGKPAPELPKKAAPLIKLLRSLRGERETLGVGGLIDKILFESGYDEFLEKLAREEGVDSRKENVLEFQSLAVEYSKDAGKRDLEGFLSRVSLMSDTDVEDFGEGRVKLVTLHSAKGLEFPIVFIVGVEEGLLPHGVSIEENEDVEEERRLAYVGITRAKDKLYLINCRSRLIFGRVVHNDPSRFLHEIGEEHLQVVGVADGASGESFFEEDEDFAPGPAAREFSATEIPARETQRPDQGLNQYYPGQRVVHPDMGEGCVVSTRGNEISVAFPGKGIKVFDANFAPFYNP